MMTTHKLAKIQHYRCGEPIWREGYTYVWVPESWDGLTLQDYVDAAQKSYLETENEFKKLAPVPPPGYGVTITPSTPDSATVAELKAEHAVKEKAYKEYQAMVDKSRKPFAWHLKQVSGGAVLQFWENEIRLTAEANWGHQHGTTIEYGSTKLQDYPFPKDEDDL